MQVHAPARAVDAVLSPPDPTPSAELPAVQPSLDPEFDGQLPEELTPTLANPLVAGDRLVVFREDGLWELTWWGKPLRRLQPGKILEARWLDDHTIVSLTRDMVVSVIDVKAGVLRRQAHLPARVSCSGSQMVVKKELRWPYLNVMPSRRAVWLELNLEPKAFLCFDVASGQVRRSCERYDPRRADRPGADWPTPPACVGRQDKPKQAEPEGKPQAAREPAFYVAESQIRQRDKGGTFVPWRTLEPAGDLACEWHGLSAMGPPEFRPPSRLLNCAPSPTRRLSHLCCTGSLTLKGAAVLIADKGSVVIGRRCGTPFFGQWLPNSDVWLGQHSSYESDGVWIPGVGVFFPGRNVLHGPTSAAP